MDINLAIICLLTFIIHLIGTLAYAVRIAGVRTRRIAVSFALFNILILVSRTAAAKSCSSPSCDRCSARAARAEVCFGLIAPCDSGCQTDGVE